MTKSPKQPSRVNAALKGLRLWVGKLSLRLPALFVAFVGAWLLYFLSLGPVYWLLGHDLLPEPVGYKFFWPAIKLCGGSNFVCVFTEACLDDYLDWWWLDPNKPGTTR